MRRPAAARADVLLEILPLPSSAACLGDALDAERAFAHVSFRSPPNFALTAPSAAITISSVSTPNTSPASSHSSSACSECRPTAASPAVTNFSPFVPSARKSATTSSVSPAKPFPCLRPALPRQIQLPHVIIVDRTRARRLRGDAVSHIQGLYLETPELKTLFSSAISSKG